MEDKLYYSIHGPDRKLDNDKPWSLLVYQYVQAKDCKGALTIAPYWHKPRFFTSLESITKYLAEVLQSATDIT